MTRTTSTRTARSGAAASKRVAPRDRLVYVPDLGAIVQPLIQTGNRWHCQVIGSQSTTARFVLVPQRMLAAGVEPDRMDHTDPETFHLAWLAGVHEQLPATRAFQLAHVLAQYAHRHRTPTITLDAAVRRQLVIAAHLRPPGLQQLLALLTDAGLLAWAQDNPGADMTITLTVLTPRARTSWRRRRSSSGLEQPTERDAIGRPSEPRRADRTPPAARGGGPRHDQ